LHATAAPWNDAQNEVLNRLDVLRAFEDYFADYEKYGHKDEEDCYDDEVYNDYEDFTRMP
jgi:hypothetical protein